MTTVVELQNSLAKIDAHEAKISAGTVKDYPSLAIARDGARRILNERIAAIQANQPDPYADVHAVGEAGQAKGPNRPRPFHLP